MEALRSAGDGWLLNQDSPLRPHFEELARNVLSLVGDEGCVVVTGPEPGSGRTSVCIGLGGALAGMGRPAAIVDCNLEEPALHRVLGEPNFVGLTSGLEGGRSLADYGREVVPGLLAVSTGPVLPDPDVVLGSEDFVNAVQGLASGRIVLLDAPVAGRVLASPALSEAFDGVLLVVHASRTSKNAAREATDDLLEAGVNLLGVVLNGCA